MKTKNIFHTAALFIPLLFVSSCSKDFLERPPLDKLTDGIYYQDDEQVIMGTAPLYNAVWHQYNTNVIINLGDIRGGNMHLNDRQNFYKFSIPASAFEVIDAWRSFYNTIGQSNLIMFYLNERAGSSVTDEIKNHAMAEARFMRAMAYYFLVTNWGPVPIIYDNLVQMDDTSISRNTPETVWEFILRDLRFAVNNLPEQPLEAGRITKWTAEGMLAKSFLAFSGYGSTNGSRNQALLDSAKFYSGHVCNNSGLSLMESYPELYKTENDNNEESLFAFQWLPIRIWGINNTHQAYYAYDPKLTGTGDGWGASHGASYNMLHEYEPEDTIRRKATFMMFGDYYPEILKDEGGLMYKYKGFFNRDSCEDYEGRYITDISKLDSRNHDSLTDIANIKKYIVGTPADNDGQGDNMATGNNTYVLRLAEVYLIYAESILGNNNLTDDPEALKFFNLVRKRAKVPEKEEITFSDLLHEYRVEFAIEGNYWYQLVRWFYFDKTGMFDYVAGQEKGDYSYDVNPSNGEITYNLPKSEKYSCNDVTVYLPLPEEDMVKAPNLAKDPVPFDFSVLGE